MADRRIRQPHLRVGEGVPVAQPLGELQALVVVRRPWPARRPGSCAHLRGRWPGGAARDQRPRRPGGMSSAPGRDPGPAPRPGAGAGPGHSQAAAMPASTGMPSSSNRRRATSACRVDSSIDLTRLAGVPAAPREIRARSPASSHRASADSSSRSASAGAPRAAARASGPLEQDDGPPRDGGDIGVVGGGGVDRIEQVLGHDHGQVVLVVELVLEERCRGQVPGPVGPVGRGWSRPPDGRRSGRSGAGRAPRRSGRSGR